MRVRSGSVCSSRPSRPTIPPPQDAEAAEREAQFERQQAEYEEERQRREEERKQQFGRQQSEIEAKHNRRAEIIKGREATFERILKKAPAKPKRSPTSRLATLSEMQRLLLTSALHSS